MTPSSRIQTWKVWTPGTVMATVTGVPETVDRQTQFPVVLPMLEAARAPSSPTLMESSLPAWVGMRTKT